MSNPAPTRDAFGRLLTSPAKLPLRARVEALRRLAGELLASPGVEQRWLGEVLLDRVHRGGDLEILLGLRAVRGSHSRAEALVRQAETGRLLLRLSMLLGSDTRASRVLRGLEDVPAVAADLVVELRARRAPSSRRAFVRAREASRHSG